ncbi:MAG: hypothetical protein AAF135_20695 [Bacteroidota bacterium]
MSRDQKTLAFGYFTLYPIEDHIEWEKYFVDDRPCFFHVGEQRFEAYFGQMIANEKDVGFTMALHKDLEEDELPIHCEDHQQFSLFNLWGNEGNTQFIQDLIDALRSKQLDNWGKLSAILVKECVFENSFRKSFDALRQEEVEAILSKLKEIKGRGLTTPFAPDTKIVKEVSSDSKMTKVRELRIYQPVALRLYFQEEGEKIFLLSIQKKSNPDQNKDIKEAQRMYKRLRLTRN